MVDDAMYSHRVIAMVQPFLPENADPEIPVENPPLMRVGCLGRINSYSETDDGRYLLNLRGLCRFHILEEEALLHPYRTAKVSYENFVEDMKPISPKEPDIERSSLTKALKTYLSTNAIQTDWDAVADAPLETLINALASGCPFSTMEKQMLLEFPTLQQRGDALISLLQMDATGGSGSIQ